LLLTRSVKVVTDVLLNVWVGSAVKSNHPFGRVTQLKYSKIVRARECGASPYDLSHKITLWFSYLIR
jgi:hypothetical protein